MTVVAFPTIDKKTFTFSSTGDDITWENTGYTAMELFWALEQIKSIILNGEYE
jgi:hypothetical protein